MTKEMLAIKFEGRNLSKQSLPIYELGTAFIAIQRIVHKAALYEDGKLEKGVLLPAKRRQQLALQVADHRKGSDLWGLAPYLTDPAAGPILQNLISAGFVALGAYVLGKVGKNKTPPANQVLIVNIFPEVKQLIDRIGNIGGVDQIELSQPGKAGGHRLVIDAQTQARVRELEYQLVDGPRQTIAGMVTRLLPQSFRLDISDAPDHFVRILMNEALFEKVRRLPVLMEREIRFEGIPMYRIGDGTSRPHCFRADRVVIPRKRKR